MPVALPTPEHLALVDALAQRDEALFFKRLTESSIDPLQRFSWAPSEEEAGSGDTHPITEHDTLLFHAAKHGCGQVATYLLEQGEDPNHIGASRMTAMAAFMMSAPASETEAKGWLPALVALLAHGAEMDRSWVVGTEGPYTARNIARRLAERGGATWPQFVLEQWWPQEGKARHLDNRLPPAPPVATRRF